MSKFRNTPISGLVAFLLVGALFVGVNLLFEGRAFGAVDPRIGNTESSCPTEDPCTSPTSMAKAFKDHRLGHKPKNFKFPDKVRRMLKHNYAATHNNNNRCDGVGGCVSSWWNSFNDSMSCVPNDVASGDFTCSAGSPEGLTASELATFIKPTVKVTVACGGAAALGSLRGGGWWGAGVGGGACLWGKVVDLW